jgi:hypothetical protein
MKLIASTFPPRVFQTAAGLLLLASFFVMPACRDSLTDLYVNESNTTSGSVGPFIETSNLKLTTRSFSAPPDAPGKEGMIIDFSRGDTSDTLRVGSGDTLLVALDNVPQSIEEVRFIGCSGPLGPCYYVYYYRVYFSGDTERRPLTISLERETGESSHTTVTFPSRPTISEPAPGALITLSTDTLSISWQPGDAGDETKLSVRGDCGASDYWWFLPPVNSSISTYSFAPGTFSISTDREFCRTATELPLPLHTARYRNHTADPALAPGSLLQLSIEDEITVQMQR